MDRRIRGRGTLAQIRQALEGIGWRAPGALAFVLYVLATILVLGALVLDASRAANAEFALHFSSVKTYAVNSLIIGVPTATLCVIAASYLAYRLRFLTSRYVLYVNRFTDAFFLIADCNLRWPEGDDGHWS